MTPSAKPAGPVFLRLDGRTGWRMDEKASSAVAVDAVEGVLRLTGRSASAISLAEPGGTFGGVTFPTGLAEGPDGRLFLADPGGNRILTHTNHDEAFLPLWEPVAAEAPPGGPCNFESSVSAPDAYTLSRPRGVAYRDGLLVVADTGHDRVILYTWPGLAPRHVIDLPGASPWDVEFDARSYLYVAGEAAGRVYRFDRLWRLDQSYEGGEGTLRKPRHVAIDTDGFVFVLDDALGRVLALDRAGKVVNDDVADLSGHVFRPPLQLRDKKLWLPQRDRPLCPMLEIKGVEVDRQGRLVSEIAGGGAPMLLARPTGASFPRQGRYVSQPLDSAIFDCAWHRLTFDLDLPEATFLTVRTFTAPAPLESERILGLPLDRWSTPITLLPGDLPEVLVQSPPGRYLWLRVDFGGNGQASPLIRTIKVYAPRASSFSYLPPVYHDDPVSADFLDRFLSYFDTVFEEIETVIEDFSGYLDPYGVPPGPFITWLGEWLDLSFLAEWPEATRRTLIDRAIELYKKRGTIAGIQEIVRLHTGLGPPFPVVVEHFRLRDYGDRREVPEDDLVDGIPFLAGSPLAPSTDPDELTHHFTILLPDKVAQTDDELATLRHLIDAQKPAHTRYRLRLVRPGFRIGCQSTVGADALIGPYPQAPLGEMMLAHSSQLADGAPPVPRLNRFDYLVSPD